MSGERTLSPDADLVARLKLALGLSEGEIAEHLLLCNRANVSSYLTGRARLYLDAKARDRIAAFVGRSITELRRLELEL